jgi:hypothetical protein
MQKWNCEIIPDDQLPFSVMSFCRRIKGVAVRVPVRLNGMTSSGKKGGCYYNVNIATKLFGGSSLVGWVVAPPDSSLPLYVTANLLGHAVWLNTQNRASCVTAKSWNSRLVTEKEGKQFLDMIIWKEIHSGIPFTLYNLHCVRDKVRQRNLIVWNDRVREHFIPQDNLNAIKAESLFGVSKNNISERDFEARMKRSFSADEAMRKIIEGYEKLGGFTEASVATGRTYEEIKNDRIERLK